MAAAATPRRRRHARRLQLPARDRLVPGLSRARPDAAALADPSPHRHRRRPARRRGRRRRGRATPRATRSARPRRASYGELIDEVRAVRGRPRADRRAASERGHSVGARELGARRGRRALRRPARRRASWSTRGRPPPTSSDRSPSPTWSRRRCSKAGELSAVMVGDSTWDVEAAARAEVKTIARAHRRLLRGGAARRRAPSTCSSRWSTCASRSTRRRCAERPSTPLGWDVVERRREPLSPDDARILALESEAIAGHTLKLVRARAGARAARPRGAAGERRRAPARRAAGPHAGRAEPASGALGRRRAASTIAAHVGRRELDRGARRGGAVEGRRRADVRAARPRPAAVALRPRRAAGRRARGDRRPHPPRDGRRDQLGALPRRGALGGGRRRRRRRRTPPPGRSAGEALARGARSAACPGAIRRELGAPRLATRRSTAAIGAGARARLRRRPARRAEARSAPRARVT